MAAIAIGVAVSCVCYGAIMLKGGFGYDDSLDVFGVHGVGGMVGALSVGVLATAGISGDPTACSDGNASLLAKPGHLGRRGGGYSFVVSFVLLKIVDALVGLRVTTEEEEVGLDLTQHGERGYIMGVGELMGDLPEQEPLPPLSKMAAMPVSEQPVGV